MKRSTVIFNKCIQNLESLLSSKNTISESRIKTAIEDMKALIKQIRRCKFFTRNIREIGWILFAEGED